MLKIRIHEKLTASKYTQDIGNYTLEVKPAKGSKYLAFTLIPKFEGVDPETFFLPPSDVYDNSTKVKNSILAAATNLAKKMNYEFDPDTFDIYKFGDITKDEQPITIDSILKNKLTVDDLDSLDDISYDGQTLYAWDNDLDNNDELYNWFMNYLDYNRSGTNSSSLTDIFKELNSGMKSLELNKLSAKFAPLLAGDADIAFIRPGMTVLVDRRKNWGTVVRVEGTDAYVKDQYNGTVKKFKLLDLVKLNPNIKDKYLG